MNLLCKMVWDINRRSMPRKAGIVPAKNMGASCVVWWTVSDVNTHTLRRNVQDVVRNSLWLKIHLEKSPA